MIDLTAVLMYLVKLLGVLALIIVDTVVAGAAVVAAQVRAISGGGKGVKG